MKARIAVLGGDGIGPEVTVEAVRVLEAVAEAHGHTFEFTTGLISGAAIDATGTAFPPATRQLCAEADGVLLGAVGGPRWSAPDAPVRPEQGLLEMRASMGVFANLRPVVTHACLYASSPLKPERLIGVDILVIRELTGGIYFGKKERSPTAATDVCTYSRPEIERVLRMAGQMATRRQGKVTSVDKANVLETSRLWRATAIELYAREFPHLEIEHLLVDSAAMHLLSRAADFDVLVTENMFGDILTDEASMLTGSLGMLPSAALGSGTRGLYEPIHGSAPDIAGQSKANPCGTILSAAMLLEYSLGLVTEARQVQAAVLAAIQSGQRTPDIQDGRRPPVNTRQMTDGVLRVLQAL